MERFRKLAIMVMALLVAWSEPLTCRAQGLPAASQPSAAGSIPPPRAFAASQPGAIAISATSPAQPEPTPPAAGPAGGQRARSRLPPPGRRRQSVRSLGGTGPDLQAQGRSTGVGRLAAPDQPCDRLKA